MSKQAKKQSLSLKEGESRTLLSVLSKEMFAAGLISADDLLYGSTKTFAKTDGEYKGLVRVMEAIPLHVRNAFNAELRKVQADKLRASAERLERGEAE